MAQEQMCGFCWTAAPILSGVAKGGGPEVLLESLVLTFSRLQALAAASSSPRDTHEVGLQAE